MSLLFALLFILSGDGKCSHDVSAHIVLRWYPTVIRLKHGFPSQWKEHLAPELNIYTNRYRNDLERHKANKTHDGEYSLVATYPTTHPISTNSLDNWRCICEFLDRGAIT